MTYGLVLEHPKSEMFTLLAEGSRDEMHAMKDRLQEHFGSSANHRMVLPQPSYPDFGYAAA